MSHQVLQEIVRARLPIRPEVFRRWQQAIQQLLIDAARPDPEPEPVAPAKKRGDA